MDGAAHSGAAPLVSGVCMNEQASRLREQLSVARAFAVDAPFEALARAHYVEREAGEALASAHAQEQAELSSLRLQAVRLARKFEAACQRAQAEALARERVTYEREMHALEVPLTPKS